MHRPADHLFTLRRFGGPRSVLGHLHVFFTLSMIPPDAPEKGNWALDRPEADQAHVTVLWFLPTDLVGASTASTPGFLVEADGIEPTTSCLQSRRSPN